MIRHILVHLENVFSKGIKINNPNLKTDMHIKMYIMYTEHYANVSLDAMGTLMGCNMELIRVPSGDESLDKHLIGLLGFLIGEHVTKNQRAKSKKDEAFIVVSNDKGYDNICQMMSSRYNVYCQRFVNVEQAMLESRHYEKIKDAVPLALDSEIMNKCEMESEQHKKQIEALERKLEENERELKALREKELHANESDSLDSQLLDNEDFNETNYTDTFDDDDLDIWDDWSDDALDTKVDTTF